MEATGLAVGFDFDDVLAQTDKTKLRYARKVYGMSGLSPPVKRQFVVGSGLMTEDDYRKLQLEVGGTWEWGELIEPMPGALEVIPALYADGCPLSVVTSRTDEVINGLDYKLLSIAERLLRAWGLLEYFKDVKGAGYHNSKAPVIEKLKPRPSVFIDDGLPKLVLLRGLVRRLYLFSRPHNMSRELPPDIRRIDSLWQFYEVICELKSEPLVAAMR